MHHINIQPFPLGNTKVSTAPLLPEMIQPLSEILKQPAVHRLLPGYLIQPSRFEGYFTMLAAMNEHDLTMGYETVNQLSFAIFSHDEKRMDNGTYASQRNEGGPLMSPRLLEEKNSIVSKSLIGVCTAVPPDNAPNIYELGFLLDPAYQGKGIIHYFISAMQEILFHQLKAQRITADIMGNNVASARALEKVGLVKEATQRDYYHINNRFVDRVHYGKVSDRIGITTTRRQQYGQKVN